MFLKARKLKREILSEKMLMSGTCSFMKKKVPDVWRTSNARTEKRREGQLKREKGCFIDK